MMTKPVTQIATVLGLAFGLGACGMADARDAERQSREDAYVAMRPLTAPPTLDLPPPGGVSRADPRADGQ